MILAGAYYNLDKKIQAFARGDFVNHFASVGGTYKMDNMESTISSEVFYGLPGCDPKTGADVSHPVIAGTPVWLRLGVDCNVSKDTSINWKGLLGSKIGSTLTLQQKINKNIKVGFVNDYQTGKDVKVGMTFDYSL